MLEERTEGDPAKPPGMTGQQAIREIRINPVVPGESVLIATARSLRPKKEEPQAPHDPRPHVDACPFCRGNEAKTPPVIGQVPASGDWRLRIVENLYPVLGDDRQNPGLSFGLQQTIDGYGRHEVVIDHSSHGIRVHQMEDAHLALLFSAYRDRMDALYRANPSVRAVLVFKNFGPAAGASISHTHSQIVAMPVVPANIEAEVLSSAAYHDKTGRCIFCSLIDEALTFEATFYDRESGVVRRKISVGQYVIERGKRFLAIKPFASRFEWEVQVLPLGHDADFLHLSDDDAAELGRVFRRTMARLNEVLGGAQYNFFIHSLPHGPAADAHRPSYHWHIEICPRTSVPTGFELGSGLFMNTISPEDAAARLRSVVLPE
jgi:UDPglucose--hexose-1-phosphate uridylyltransferase